MPSYRTYAAVAVMVSLAALATAVDSQPATRPMTQPATKAANVPTEIIEQIEAQFVRPEKQMSQAELSNLLRQRMARIIELGLRAEELYPNASNLHVVRGSMLPAADFLDRDRKDAASRKVLLDLAGRILASGAPAKVKAEADFFVTSLKVTPVESQPAPKNAGELITEMVRRYDKTDGATVALINAAILARQNRLADLREKLLDDLGRQYPDDSAARSLLRQAGRHPDVGRPFVAKLTGLDGRSLRLPEDLKGKVVVVDFWATWCAPCRAAVPRMKQLYAKYKEQGMEVVGISLDTDKAALQQYIRDEGLGWIHTFAGQQWNDPTARKYGIEAIPSVWLIGRDGKVISDSAREELDALVPEALKAPTR